MKFIVYYDESWEQYIYRKDDSLLFDNEVPILITSNENLAKIVNENLNKKRKLKLCFTFTSMNVTKFSLKQKRN